MADPSAPETIPVDLPAAPAAPAAVEPAAIAAPAPAAPVEAAPAPAAVVEPAAPIAPAEPKLEPTLLERLDKERADKEAAEKAVKPAEVEAKTEPKVEAKPEENKPEPAKPAEAEKPVEAKPAEPFEYKFELPEVLKADEKKLGTFRDLLGEGDVRVPAEKAQKLLNLHAEAMQEFAAQTRRDQFDIFNKTKAEGEKLIMADPEFGGAGFETASRAVARARDNLISSARPGTPQYERDRGEFDQFVALTGAGSFPAFWRILHNAARYLDEPQADSVPAEIRPPKGNGRAPRGGIYSEESRRKMSGAN